MNKFKSTENRVRQIMKDNPSTRSSNDELVIKTYESYGLTLTPEQIALLKQAPSFETITRCRRKIQENGEFEATATVQALRKKQEHVYIDYSKYRITDPITGKVV